MRTRRSWVAVGLAALWAWPAEGAAEVGALDRCLTTRSLPRVARVVAPDGAPIFVGVVSQSGGFPTAVVPLDGVERGLTALFDRALAETRAGEAAPWALRADVDAGRVCAPMVLPQSAIDSEARVIVATGLNYAAHAEEAGGGDVFLFPKPAAPTRPYGELARPEGTTLLDYEVELGFVLLVDLDLRALPSSEALLDQVAFFVANDVSDRAPIIRGKALRGPGTGFVTGKGQPGFLPAGPWMVRGRELAAALEACGGDGLGIRLEVDAGEGFRLRQDSSTERMLLDPAALLARIAEEVGRHGLHTPMPVVLDGETRHYPLAVDAEAPRLPAGSIVLTGTPDGVALATPEPLPLLARGLLRLRSPFAQFLHEEQVRVAAGGSGYLRPGDRVRASIDGLGAQIVRIVGPNGASPNPCQKENHP